MKYLGIDFGGKNVGVAISDDDGQIAFPKGVLKNEGGLIGAIKRICQDEKVERIVLGKSLDANGVPNEIQAQIENFKIALEEEIKIPVKWQTESFSSMHVMDEAKNGGEDHAQAAALILQRFLERISTS